MRTFLNSSQHNFKIGIIYEGILEQYNTMLHLEQYNRMLHGDLFPPKKPCPMLWGLGEP
jgi:hypothetical protein